MIEKISSFQCIWAFVLVSKGHIKEQNKEMFSPYALEEGQPYKGKAHL